MRWGVAFVLVMLASPAVASGEVLCVPSTSIPGCPAAGSANEPTIQDAVNNGNSGDEILIGPDSANSGHPYNESVTDSATAYSFVGAGVGKTIIQGQGSPAMTVASGSTVTGLTINLYNSTGNTGLSLAANATASGVAITATGPLSTMNNIGVDLTGGTFSHGTVTLPLTGGDTHFYGGVIGSGTVSDSSITAEVGITGDGSGNMPVAHRDTITANEGVVDEGAATIDDSLIKTVGPTGELGIGMDSQMMFGTITARHVTMVGSDSAGSVGLSAQAFGGLPGAATTALLASSIVQGYASSIDATATASPFSATTVVTVDHSFYDPSTEHIADGSGAAATITPDSASGDHNPLFVDPAGGDYELQAGSPAIDAGDPAPLAAGESTTDLAGNPRAIAGRKGDAAVGDVGAYEFQPHAPTVSAQASAVTARPGQAIVFTASGSDPAPGDSLTYRWTFSGGGTATGARTAHSFARPGRYTATVTATDLDGFTAVATRTVTATVPKPRLSGLKLKPRSFKRGPAATIGYRDSAAATTTLTIEHHKGRRWVKVLALKHHDRTGADKVKLKSGRLKAGAYRVVAVARDAGGTSNRATARFTVKS